MSLLQKASIITTPTAYAEDYLYSIKPAYQIGANEVANGDMELDCCWANYASATVTNERSTEEVHSGSYSRKYVTSGGTGGIQSNYFTTSTGKTYNLTFWVYPSTGTVQRIAVRRGDNGAWSIDNTFTGLTQNAWNKCTFTYTEAVGGATAYIAFHSNSATGTWYIDDVSINGITDADFDFDRNSTGSRVNEDYLIEDVPYNLFTYSEQIDSSDWDKVGTTVIANDLIAPDGTLSADKVNENAGGTYHNVNWDGLVENGLTYTVSVFFKSGERTNANIYENVQSGSLQISSFNLSTGEVISQDSAHTAKIESAGKNWFRCSITFTPNARRTGSVYLGVNDSMIYTGVADNGVYMWGAQLVKGDQPKDYLKTTDRLDIPRIDYTNGEPSILLEPSRTNSYQYSNDITQSFWFNLGVLIDTSNLYLSPEGINNAQKITADSGSYRLLRPTTGISGSGYTQSIFVKNINALNFYLRTASGFSYYNFETKTINLAFSGDNLTAIHYPNDWVRLITTTPNASYKQFGFGQNETDFNEIGRSAYIYGAQLEAGSYPTSVIHTSGSAVTRSADVANNAGNSDLINSTEGVLYAEMKGLADGGDIRAISIFSAADNRITLALHSTTNRVQFFIAMNGFVNIVDLDATDIIQTNMNKIACKFKANDYALWINGVEKDTNTTQSNTVQSGTLNSLKFDINGSNNFYGNTKMVAVFKEALTDLELAKLTGYNNHELYMNYYNRLSYLGLAEEYNVESDINNYIL